LRDGQHCHGRFAGAVASFSQQRREAGRLTRIESMDARWRMFRPIPCFNALKCHRGIVSDEINGRNRVGALRATTGPTPEPAIDPLCLGRGPGPNVQAFEPAGGFVTDLHRAVSTHPRDGLTRSVGVRSDDMR
jgi:hypothetical protein